VVSRKTITLLTAIINKPTARGVGFAIINCPISVAMHIPEIRLKKPIKLEATPARLLCGSIASAVALVKAKVKAAKNIAKVIVILVMVAVFEILCQSKIIVVIRLAISVVPRIEVMAKRFKSQALISWVKNVVQEIIAKQIANCPSFS